MPTQKEPDWIDLAWNEFQLDHRAELLDLTTSTKLLLKEAFLVGARATLARTSAIVQDFVAGTLK